MCTLVETVVAIVDENSVEYKIQCSLVFSTVDFGTNYDIVYISRDQLIMQYRHQTNHECPCNYTSV